MQMISEKVAKPTSGNVLALAKSLGTSVEFTFLQLHPNKLTQWNSPLTGKICLKCFLLLDKTLQENERTITRLFRLTKFFTLLANPCCHSVGRPFEGFELEVFSKVKLRFHVLNNLQIWPWFHIWNIPNFVHRRDGHAGIGYRPVSLQIQRHAGMGQFPFSTSSYP